MAGNLLDKLVGWYSDNGYWEPGAAPSGVQGYQEGGLVEDIQGEYVQIGRPKKKEDTAEGDINFESMSVPEIKAYIKSNYKIKEVLPFIASNPVISKKLGMDVDEYNAYNQRYQTRLDTQFPSTHIYLTNAWREKRMRRLFDLGFGQEEQDTVNWVPSSRHRSVESDSPLSYPGYTGYFNPKTWGTGK